MSGHILSKSVTPKSSPGCKNGIMAGSRATGLTSSGETGDLGGVRGWAGGDGAGQGLTHREAHTSVWLPTEFHLGSPAEAPPYPRLDLGAGDFGGHQCASAPPAPWPL